jgi:hypothetical protein
MWTRKNRHNWGCYWWNKKIRRIEAIAEAAQIRGFGKRQEPLFMKRRNLWHSEP